jgi:predicted flap endonuclease-1-like 5' DNA nuclease
MNQSSAKSSIVILLLTAALFLAMNRIVQAAPLADWGLVIALLAVALLLVLPDRVTSRIRRTSESAAEAPATPPSTLRVYEAPAPQQAATSRRPAAPLTEPEDDYTQMRDREASADAMASAAHMGSREARANVGAVENVMAVGATGEHHEVDEIAGGPTKSLSGTQEMRPVTASAAAASPDVVLTEPTGGAVVSPSSEPVRTTPESNPPQTPVSDEDDLTLIEGIGPKMAAALKAAGIVNFTQLQSASLPDLEAAIRNAGMRFAPSMPTWAEQAAYAVRGDWDELKAFQKTLKSGRKK